MTPYVDAGLPRFDYYDADETDLAASETLAKVKPVGQFLGKDGPFTSVDPATVVALKDKAGDVVSPGTW